MATEFRYPAGVGHDTLIREESDENFAKLTVDFTREKPIYVGYAVKLGNRDWTWHYDNNKVISFYVHASSEIKRIILEVKGEGKSIISKKPLNIASTGRVHKFKLKDLSDFSYEFSKMSELVFLFTAENVDGKGTVEISNLKIS